MVNDMEQFLAGLGAALLAVFGNSEFQKWRQKRNGETNTDRLVKKLDGVINAIHIENSTTRQVLHHHNETTQNITRELTAILTTMKQDCAVSHEKIAGLIKK